ncbi:hypothetical protein [Dokdonella soli]|uniref:Uncharacterized protein n=1 Tax=Dokdonella soli TaxID=529810 RepID=A0ABN1IUC7_9GAMM
MRINVIEAVNAQQAEIALLRIMVMLLHDHIHNKPALLKDFDEVTEDHAVRAMNSTMPEAFFQSFEECRAVYRESLVQSTARPAP